MAATLVLDNTWRPLEFIAPERAIVLCLMDKATVISEYENKVYHSQYLTINVPKIISLKIYVPLSDEETSKITRRILLARDNYTCQYCGTHAKDLPKGSLLTKDHIIPVSKFEGSTRAEKYHKADTWENVVTACSSCNNKKDNKLLEEVGMKLRSKPVRPKGITLTLLAEDEEQLKYIKGEF